jgi:hypothetical protein
MELSSSQGAAGCSGTQEFRSTLCNMKVHYYGQKSRPLVSILRQTNPVHITPSYLSKINFNIVAYLPHARTVEPQYSPF